MLISEGSGAVGSSDLYRARVARHAGRGAASPKYGPFGLSLSKGRSFFRATQEEVRCFDKLSPNGFGIRIPRLYPRSTNGISTNPLTSTACPLRIVDAHPHFRTPPSAPSSPRCKPLLCPTGLPAPHP